jgi:pyruvate,orthophosphate dikinase
VPPGFTITTAVCTQFYADNKRYPDGLRAQVDTALLEIGRNY